MEMKLPSIIKAQKKAENLLYIALWLVLFAAPVLSMYVQRLSSHGMRGSWGDVFAAWGLLAMFCATFFVHNFLLAPLLVQRGRKWGYFAGLATLLVCFELYECLCRPHPPHPDGVEWRQRMEERGGKAGAETFVMPARSEGAQPRDAAGGERRRAYGPPLAFGGKDMVAFIIMTLLLGLNIGVKYFFKGADDRKRLERLEREGQRMQLEYLKYQVNPHFFMNTLNNIHALVDINPAQAQHTIEVLSHLMRYVLYESNRPMVKMGRDVSFLKDYIRLMRIRYAESVRIGTSFPESPMEGTVPPLLFVCFVENAFKHGVSYERKSYIDVRISTEDGRVHFTCRNSVRPESKGAHGGVGLENARKRLALTYGKDFRLDIRPTADEYSVSLDFPLSPPAAKGEEEDETTN